MPFRLRHLASGLLLACLASPSVAAEACLLEGRLRLEGMSADIRDCIENTGMTETQFHATCERHLEEAKALATSVGGRIDEARIGWMERCPRPAQGMCRNYAGGPLNALYYRRTAEDLANLPAGCSALGGEWVEASGLQ